MSGEADMSLWVKVGLFAAGLVATVVGWFGRRQIKRIDALEEDAQDVNARCAALEHAAITQAGVDATASRLERSMERYATETRSSLKALHQRMDKLDDRLYEEHKRGLTSPMAG